MKVFLIPGVGSDRRLFDNFTLDGHEIVYLDWLPFGKAKGLREYAEVMAKAINTDPPFALLGVSMGGMVATEMAKLLHPEKTILVSSSKTHKEFPPKIKMFRAPRLHYLGGPGGMLKWFALRMKFVLGTKGGGNSEVVTAMLKDTGNKHLRTSILAVMNWRNLEIHSSIVHIHGTKDWTLPHKYVKADHYIEGGSHLMIYDKAEEISTLVHQILDDK
ncbi:MAG: alpha/beta hydrolase [Flavobacteriales bacterium]|nr:alpha/beta hydrolase [Flavobacteriales bacterium]